MFVYFSTIKGIVGNNSFSRKEEKKMSNKKKNKEVSKVLKKAINKAKKAGVKLVKVEIR